MRRAMIYSAMLHLSVAVVAVLGLPVLSDREPVVDRPVVVEMVRFAEETTPPPSPPKREPPKPTPPRRIAPQPEPVKPKAVEIPPPPKAVAIPPPPPKTALAKPEPKPEPKPKVKPKPKPKVTKVVPKPKPRANKLAKVQPRPKPLTPREDFIAPVLKNLSREKRRPTETKPPEKVAERAVPALPPPRPSVDLRMTVSELDAIRRQIEACWSLPAGARDAENLVVDIRVIMNPDGTVRQASIVDLSRMAADSFFRAAAESARRAVLNPRCNPLKLPLKKYKQWQTFTLSFNPRDMIGS
ncbi:MAG: energy transducer TonB [Alphaproteobacteria bacterium]